MKFKKEVRKKKTKPTELSPNEKYTAPVVVDLVTCPRCGFVRSRQTAECFCELL